MSNVQDLTQHLPIASKAERHLAACSTEQPPWQIQNDGTESVFTDICVIKLLSGCSVGLHVFRVKITFNDSMYVISKCNIVTLLNQFFVSVVSEERKISIFFIIFMLVWQKRKNLHIINCQNIDLPGNAVYFLHKPVTKKCDVVEFSMSFTFCIHQLFQISAK